MGALGWAAWVLVAVWVGVLVAPWRPWTTAVRLPPAPAAPVPAGPDPSLAWPPVAVVVAARDEAGLLARSVGALARQDYPGPATVVVVDDESTDGTAEAARAAAAGGRVPLEVLRGAPRPEGWVGKSWALHQGVAHLAAADDPPKWVLFTDADIVHPDDSLRRLVSAALGQGLDEVSLMARLRVDTGWERLVVPAFVYFFALLYPFRLVAARGPVAAAAGGCVLVRAEALERAGGVAVIRSAMIDDVALARALKRSGARIWLGLADDVVSVRPYPHLGDLWRMVARSAFTQLRHSLLLLAATVVALLAVFVGPVAALAAGIGASRPLVALAGAVAWAVMTGTYLPMVRYYRLSPAWALGLPAAALLYAAMTVDSARRHRRGGVEWKGRRYRPE